MNLDHLKYFATAAETLHTGHASKILHVSQSTISHGIKRIEEEFGVDLFEKIGKRLALTEAGKRLAERARKLLNESEQLKNEFKAGNFPLGGTIRVGATHGIASILVAPIFGTLQKEHPDLVIEFFSLRSSQVVELIAAKAFDVGICLSPTTHPEISVLAKRKMRLKIAVRKGHHLFRSKPGHRLVKDLASFLCASPKAFVGIENCDDHPALLAVGLRPNTSLIFDSYEVAASYLKKSDAWCFMPDFFIDALGLEELKISQLAASAELALLAPRGRILAKSIEEKLLPLF